MWLEKQSVESPIAMGNIRLLKLDKENAIHVGKLKLPSSSTFILKFHTDRHPKCRRRSIAGNGSVLQSLVFNHQSKHLK